MSRLPLRVRLVAGFVVAMLVLLTAAGAFVYWRVEYALDRGLDTELDQATAVITPLVDASGTVTSPEAADATGTGWQVLDDTGHVLDSGGTAPAAALISAAELARSGSGPLTKDIGKLLPVADKPYRVQITALRPGDHFLVVGVRRDHRDEALRELLLQLTLAGLGALAVAAVVGDVLARAALRPVERYRRRAEEIAAGADGLRLDIPAGRDDEITRLGHTLNDMLTALERSLEHERRFINDASHELRTPLTLLKSRIQLARRRTRTLHEHEVILDELAVDLARLTDLADQLLAIGVADTVPPTDTEVTQLVRDVVARRHLADPDGADQLTVDLPAGETHAAIDSHTLDRILTNLIDNAYLHGAPPVQVCVRAVPAGADPGTDPTAERTGWTVVEVRDAGPGMPPELMAAATERFTRSAEARARPGAGLGLSIVKDMVSRAHGELRLCFDHHHSGHGQETASVHCDHATSMTATVILPRPDVPHVQRRPEVISRGPRPRTRRG
jgi:signal transduction histidine kinase